LNEARALAITSGISRSWSQALSLGYGESRMAYYKQGEKIHVEITGEVLQNDTYKGKYSTTLVRETSPDRWSHFIFLRSELVKIDSRSGDEPEGTPVTMEFDAVITGEVDVEAINTTQVQEIVPVGAYGYTHFLYLNSSSITKIEPEPPKPEPEPEPVKRGTKFRVRISGTAKNDMQLNATTQVDEDGGAYSHLLYLNSRQIRGASDYGSTDNYGTAITANFDVEITGDVANGPKYTTEVKELSDSGEKLYTHYLRLDSPSVTEIKPEPEPEPEPPKPAGGIYVKGDTINVSISGAKLGENMRDFEEGRNANLFNTTTQVIDKLYSHYLYTNGDTVNVTYGESEATVSAVFRAEIADEPFAGPNGSTRVRDTTRCIHYVNLFSDSVAKVAPDLHGGKPVAELQDDFAFATAGTIGAVPDDALAAGYIVPSSPQLGGSDQRITVSDEEIESSAILTRIAELQDRKRETRYNVVRRSPRSGQARVIGGRYGSFQAAVTFIDDNDYDIAKVGVEVIGGEGNLADAEELEKLEALNQAGLTVFGSNQWITQSVRLYNGSFFDENWARNQAAEELPDPQNVDSWPYTLIDWDYAANERLSTDYRRVEFDYTNYYGVNT
jgi:hypothetical protein